MDLIKKNLVFSIVVAVAVVVFVAGAVLSVLEMGAAGDAKKKVSSAESQHKSVLNSSIAPTEANVAASQANVESLTSELAMIREHLEEGADLESSDDSIAVMASIQQFIAAYRSTAKGHVNAAGEAAPIETPSDFAFGFDTYVDESSVEDKPEVTPIIDTQRQVLDFALTKLIAADPEAIHEVLRESPEFVLSAREVAAPATEEEKPRARRQRTNTAEDKGFQLEAPVSARVPGAIDTLAFSISFSSKTPTLRQFMNELAEFELPLVIRSIDVERPTETTASVSASAGDELSSIFGAFNQDAAPVTEAIEQKPVVKDTVSKFTIVFEYIQIVLPDTGKGEEA
ncbi:MAG: hypothetical protein AAGC73_06705 [Verrucomicrobiota bacterium]